MNVNNTPYAVSGHSHTYVMSVKKYPKQFIYGPLQPHDLIGAFLYPDG